MIGSLSEKIRVHLSLTLSNMTGQEMKPSYLTITEIETRRQYYCLIVFNTKLASRY